MIFHFNTKLHSGGSGKYFDLLQNIRPDQVFVGIGNVSITAIFHFILSNINNCRNSKYVFVFHSQLSLFLLFWFCKGPVYFIPHGIVNGKEYQWRIRNAIQFLILRYTEIQVIGCGLTEYENLQGILGPNQKKRAHLLLNPAVSVGRIPDKIGNRFLFCGPSIPQKGLVRFLELVPSNYELRCDVITNFSIGTNYSKKCEKLLQQSKVTYLGPQRVSPSLLSNYQTLVVCSAFEGLPFLVLEALSNGLTVILPNVPGCSELADCAGVVCYDLHQETLENEFQISDKMPRIKDSDIDRFERTYSFEKFQFFWRNLGC